MLPAHNRLAEIYHEYMKGRFTVEMCIEMLQCMKVNADYSLKMNHLNNQLVQARTMKDVSWEEDISARMDWLRRSGKLVKG